MLGPTCPCYLLYCVSISDTVVDTHWLLDLGGEAKACGPKFQNLDMGIDHTASVSLVQRISASLTHIYLVVTRILALCTTWVLLP